MTYSPYQHLAEDHTDVTLGFAQLPMGRGWWLPHLRAIVIDSRLGRVARRCVLAHEIVHAEDDDTQCAGLGSGTARIARRRERAADLTAARRLIPLDAFIDGLRWTNDDHQLAEILDVDLDTLHCRSSNFTADEVATIERELWDEWRSA